MPVEALVRAVRPEQAAATRVLYQFDTNPGGTTGSGINPAGMGNPNANQDSRSANDPNRPNDLTNQNRSHRRR
jgi:hypothetical protein